VEKETNNKIYIKDGIKIAQAISKLYITYRKRFIEQYYNNEKNIVTYKENKYTLKDSIILEHLRQKRIIGVFSGSIITSFICFDVDINDENYCKWAVYKIVDALHNLGILGKYIHISLSGSKGYHVEVFFDQPVYNTDVEKLYNIVLNEFDLINLKKYGDIELRPCITKTNSVLGVKLPLGINLKTNNVCWFCDYSKSLKPIKKYDYVLSIEQMPKEILLNILEKENDIPITPKQQYDIEEITEKHKSLPEYKNNIDEKYTIDKVLDLIHNGLQITGSRHNALFNIIKYYKHVGFSQEVAKEYAIQWMEQQDKTTYTTKWEAIILDINEIAEYVYSNNCSFVIKNIDINITMEEITEIIKIKGKNNRLVLYSLLIHSKRYATKNGIFYMSYNQMVEVTGLTKKTLIKIVRELEDLGLIIVNRSEITKFNTKLGKPITETNRYVVNLSGVINEIGEDKKDENLINNDKSFNICDKNCIDCFNACLCHMFTNKELKIILSERNYREVIKFREYCTNII